MVEGAGLITIAGCGPGAMEFLSLAALNAIKAAEVLVGSDDWLRRFPNVAKWRLSIGSNLQEILEAISNHHSQNRNIVVMVSGDPGLSSFAQPVVRRFGLDACRIIAGISSVQVAFARIGLAWGDARIITIHGRLPDMDPQELLSCPKAAILAGGKDCQHWVGKLLSSLNEKFCVYVCENLTLDNERVFCIQPPLIEALNLASRTILVVIRKDLIL